MDERLGGTDSYTEYRAFNSYAGERSGHVLLRVYAADPYLPSAERAQQRTRIANAYNALNHMPGHPGIVGVRDFFATENEDRYVLVTEDVPGQALRLHTDKPNFALTLDQKLHVASELLDALAHAHEHDVVHRNLTPSTLLLGTDGHLRIIGFDFARAGTDRSRSIAHEIVDDLEPMYQAPETFREPANASPASDMFSVGLVLYELFTGDKPFTSPTEVYDQGAIFPVKPSQARTGLPADIDEWLQKLCAFDPAQSPAPQGKRVPNCCPSWQRKPARPRRPGQHRRSPSPSRHRRSTTTACHRGRCLPRSTWWKSVSGSAHSVSCTRSSTRWAMCLGR